MIKPLMLLACINILLLSCNSTGPSLHCNAFHTGLFTYQSNITKKQYVFNRQKDIQIEKDLATGDSAVMKIVWNNPCEYSLYYVSSAHPEDSFETYERTHPIINTILKTGKDYCIVKSRLEGFSFTSTDTQFLVRRSLQPLKVTRD